MLDSFEILGHLILLGAHFFTVGIALTTLDGGKTIVTDVGGWVLFLSSVMMIGCAVGRVAMYFGEIVGTLL